MAPWRGWIVKSIATPFLVTSPSCLSFTLRWGWIWGSIPYPPIIRAGLSYFGQFRGPAHFSTTTMASCQGSGSFTSAPTSTRKPISPGKDDIMLFFLNRVAAFAMWYISIHFIRYWVDFCLITRLFNCADTLELIYMPPVSCTHAPFVS